MRARLKNTEIKKKEQNMDAKRRAIRERVDSDFSSPDASRAPVPTIYHGNETMEGCFQVGRHIRR